MRILALDIATTTGWAFSDSKDRHSGAHKFSAALGSFADEYETWLIRLIEQYRPDVIAVEAPVPVRGTTRLEIQLRAYGAHAITHKECKRRDVELLNVNVSQWRLNFIGRARAPKEIDGKALKPHQRRAWLKKSAVAECERRGWPVSTDDEADAVGVLFFVRGNVTKKAA